MRFIHVPTWQYLKKTSLPYIIMIKISKRLCSEKQSIYIGEAFILHINFDIIFYDLSLDKQKTKLWDHVWHGKQYIYGRMTNSANNLI